jgi:hypothetical protein
VLSRSILAFCLLTSSFIAAQQQQSQQAGPKAGQSDEVGILQAQLQVMRDEEGHLLSTVYWALSTLIAVTIAVAVLGWYLNFRISEHDRSSLKAELNTALAEAVTKRFSHLEHGFSELRSHLESSVTERLAEEERRLDAKSKGRSAQMEHDLLNLQYRFYELQGQWQERDNSLLGAWFAYRSMLRVSLQMGESWPGYALEYLKRILKAGVRLNHHHELEIRGLLSRVPDGYSADLELMDKLVKAARD